MLHYERVSGEERGAGPTLVMRTPDGNERSALGGFGPFQGQKKAGDLVVDLGFRGGPGEGGTPKIARDWTPEEAAKLNNPPPAAPPVNANGNVGEDTDFVGQTMGLLPDLRYADPARRPVLGILFMVGQGEPEKGQKTKCLVHLTPAYDARQPRFGLQALFARSGYAVGALNVKTKKIVTAVQVVFMKQKPDGTLDLADSYTSKWLGHPEEADKEGKVSSEGRKVIGMHLKHFGVVYAVALVLE
jgi:hypothetical protein